MMQVIDDRGGAKLAERLEMGRFASYFRDGKLQTVMDNTFCEKCVRGNKAVTFWKRPQIN